MGNCCRKTRVIPDLQSIEGSRVKNGGWKRKISKQMKLAKFSSRVDVISVSDAQKTSGDSFGRAENGPFDHRESPAHSGELRVNDSTLVFMCAPDIDEGCELNCAAMDNRDLTVDATNDEMSALSVETDRTINEVVSTHNASGNEDDVIRKEGEEAPVAVDDVTDMIRDKREDAFEAESSQGNLKQSKNNTFFFSGEFIHDGFEAFESEAEEVNNVEDVCPVLEKANGKSKTACDKSQNTIEISVNDTNEMINENIYMTGRTKHDTRPLKIECESKQATETSNGFKRRDEVNIETSILTTTDEPITHSACPIDDVKRGKLWKTYMLYLKSLGEEATEHCENAKEVQENKIVKNITITQKEEDIKDNSATHDYKTGMLSVNATKRQVHILRKRGRGDNKTLTDSTSTKTTNRSMLVNNTPIQRHETHGNRIVSVGTSGIHENKKNDKRNKTRNDCSTTDKTPEVQVTEYKRNAKRNNIGKPVIESRQHMTSRQHIAKRIKAVKRHKTRKAPDQVVREHKTGGSKIVKQKEFEKSYTSVVKTIKQGTEVMKTAAQKKVANTEKINNTRNIENTEAANANETCILESASVNTLKTKETDIIYAEDRHETCEVYTTSVKTLDAQHIENNDTAEVDQTRKVDNVPIDTIKTLDSKTMKPTKGDKITERYSAPHNIQDIVNSEMGKCDTHIIDSMNTNETSKTYNFNVLKREKTSKSGETKVVKINEDLTSKALKADEAESDETGKRIETLRIKEPEKVTKINKMCKTSATSEKTSKTQGKDHIKAKSTQETHLIDPVTETSMTVAVSDIRESETGEIKEMVNISEPGVRKSQAIRNECISSAEVAFKETVSGFISKSEPSLSTDNSCSTDESFLRSTKNSDTHLSAANEELKRKISQTSEESLERLVSYDGKTDCMLSVFVQPVYSDEEPKQVQVRAPSHMIRDGSAKAFIKNLEQGFLKTGVKKFDPLGKPNRTSKQCLRKSSSLVTSEDAPKIQWTQKRGPASEVQLTQVPQYYEATPKKKNMREKLGLGLLQKYKIQVQCKQIERLKVNADLFPGILPPKIKEKLDRKMEARKPIN